MRERKDLAKAKEEREISESLPTSQVWRSGLAEPPDPVVERKNGRKTGERSRGYTRRESERKRERKGKKREELLSSRGDNQALACVEVRDAVLEVAAERAGSNAVLSDLELMPYPPASRQGVGHQPEMVEKVRGRGLPDQA